MTKSINLLALLLCCCIAGRAQEPKQMSIIELFRLADAQNADINASEAGIATSRQSEAVAKNARLPQINASLTLSFLGDGTILDRDFSNPMRDRLPHFSNTLGVEVYQPLYTGGAITSGIHLAAKETELAVNGRASTVNSVRMAIVGNYLELAKQRNLLAVYTDNIALAEKLIAEMKLKHEQGIVLKNDITRYELRLSSLLYDKLATENAIRILNNNLTSLLSLDPSTEIIPDIDADGTLAVEPDYSIWIDIASTNSPTLNTFNISSDITRLSRRIAHSDYIPKIGLVAGDNLLGPITFEVPAINKNYNAWFVGVNVKWSISSLFTTSKSTHKYDLRMAELQEQRAAAQTALNRNIREALTLYRQAVERLEIENKNVQLAQENYNVVSNRFDNQLALLTDMLDASNALLDAGVRRVNADISTRLYYYQLHYLAGTLSTL